MKHLRFHSLVNSHYNLIYLHPDDYLAHWPNFCLPYTRITNHSHTHMYTQRKAKHLLIYNFTTIQLLTWVNTPVNFFLKKYFANLFTYLYIQFHNYILTLWYRIYFLLWSTCFTWTRQNYRHRSSTQLRHNAELGSFRWHSTLILHIPNLTLHIIPVYLK